MLEHSMDTERWKRVREVLAEALERPTRERAAFLDQALGEDRELRREVESLLAEAEDDETRDEEAFLAPPSPGELARAVDETDARSWVGQEIGPYVVERPIASGGMGAVFLGRRADGEFDQRVAIKLIKRGMDTEAILRRFQQERRLLAGLEHPGIARLIDGRSHTDGRPYLVMEYVEGEPIDRYCRAGALDLRARIRLFLEVCGAVQHAHQRLVVHRDLKPANILVTSEGEPKLLDFGLAKLLAPDGSEHTYDVTAEGERLMTPNYAAPEQVCGHAVTTATDVYALGVLMYELFAERSPYEVEGRGWNDVVRLVCLEDPPRPSQRVDGGASGRRARELAGDLDTIVMKAMRKEPERRYGSVEALAEDLERYLSGHPITARPDSWTYRSTKFLRRNRMLVGAASAVLVALAAGVAGVVHQAQAARTEARAAEEQRAAVMQLSALQDLEDLVEEADRLWPVHPDLVPRYDEWIDDARALLAELPQHRARRAELRALALPRTDEERRAERESHPANVELAQLARELSVRQAALRTRRDGAPVVLPEVEWERYPPGVGDLRKVALEMVQYFREKKGDEPLGLAIAESLAERAPEEPDVLFTLAWARFAMGQDEEALDAMFAALDFVPPDRAESLESSFQRLEESVREAGSLEGLEREEAELEALEARRAELAQRVDERRSWRFPEEHHEARWWHNQLEKLIEGLEALRDPESGLSSDESVSLAHGWSIPRRRALAAQWRDGLQPGGELAARWAEALPRIHAAYPGLALAPLAGLLPLGPDPQSGFWEFADLRSGSAPERDADGRLALTEESGVVFVLLPEGRFTMGAQSSDPGGPNYDPLALRREGPPHEVVLSAFFLSKYELTQGQWLRATGTNPSTHKPPSPLAPTLLHPVTHLSWTACETLCARAGWTMPSEAQWEYGARGGTDTPWWSGRDRESLREQAAANLADQAARRAGVRWPSVDEWPEFDDGFPLHAPVDRVAPNPFGLHGVHGNQREWCRDAFDVLFYTRSPVRDPLNEPTGDEHRVMRGGCHYAGADLARLSVREFMSVTWVDGTGGFRPARAIEPRP